MILMDHSLDCRYLKILPQFSAQSHRPCDQPFLSSAYISSLLPCEMGFPTLVTLTRCSKVLRGWIGELTTGDREKLSLWGIPPRLLKTAEVEVSRHLLCAAARFWKLAHHVFYFGRTELTPTLEEVRQICSFSKLMGPTVFMRWDGYIAVLRQLTGLSTVECKHKLIYTDGPTPMLHLEYFDQVAKKCAVLEYELWLRGFVTRFLGELIFSHGRMTVVIKIAEIAPVVVTQQIDLAPVVL